MTTVVVEITSSLLGQVTCFISTRTSWRNSRVSATVPLTRSPMPAAAPVIALLLDSPFFTFTAWLLIKPSSYPGALTACSVLPLPAPAGLAPQPPPHRAANSGRGGWLRTPIRGFGDRRPNRRTAPPCRLPVTIA